MSTGSTSAPRPASLLDTAQGIGATLMRALHTRVELAAVDLQRERDAMLRRLTMLVVALFSGAFGVLLAVAWLVMSVAENARTQVLGGMALAFVAIAAICVYLMRSDALRGGGFMAATLDVLGDDVQALAGSASRESAPRGPATAGAS